MDDVQIGDTFTHADRGDGDAYEVTHKVSYADVWILSSAYEVTHKVSYADVWILSCKESMRFATTAQLLDPAGPWRRCEAMAVSHG